MILSTDPCLDFDCPKGRQCFLNTTTGLAECMCRPSCKKHLNPVCGSDGILYDNHCELHRSACITGHHISIMHGVTCARATTAMPPMPPITPVASTTMAAKKVVTEEENLKASTGIGCYFTSCFKKKIDPTSVTNQVSRTADVSLYPVMV